MLAVPHAAFSPPPTPPHPPPCAPDPLNSSLSPQFDMQRITLEELKHILYHAFRDHLTMKDIENIIINEEESLNETSGNCQTEFEGGRYPCFLSLRVWDRSPPPHPPCEKCVYSLLG